MEVLKTSKMYVGGAFIRTESGRTFENGEYRINEASRKDFRNAVEKAKAGFKSWSSKTAYNRSQILYRMAEMAQGKFDELTKIIISQTSKNEAEVKADVQAGIDTFVYYAGFCDKFQQVTAGLNPVAMPYHNFTTPQAMGVVALIDSDEFNFQKLIDNICAIITSGNSVITLLSSECPAIVSILGEVFATSDLPAGTVNLLTGHLSELAPIIATHMELNAISFQNEDEDTYFEMRADSVDNMKRIIGNKADKRESLDLILDFVEQKTVWHPIGV